MFPLRFSWAGRGAMSSSSEFTAGLLGECVTKRYFDAREVEEEQERARLLRPYIFGAVALGAASVVMANVAVQAMRERDCWRAYFEQGVRPLDGTCRMR